MNLTKNDKVYKFKLNIGSPIDYAKSTINQNITVCVYHPSNDLSN